MDLRVSVTKNLNSVDSKKPTENDECMGITKNDFIETVLILAGINKKVTFSFAIVSISLDQDRGEIWQLIFLFGSSIVLDEHL
jgi:hypothetical protein